MRLHDRDRISRDRSSHRAIRIITTDRNVSLPNLLYNNYVVDSEFVWDVLDRELTTDCRKHKRRE